MKNQPAHIGVLKGQLHVPKSPLDLLREDIAYLYAMKRRLLCTSNAAHAWHSCIKLIGHIENLIKLMEDDKG